MTTDSSITAQLTDFSDIALRRWWRAAFDEQLVRARTFFQSWEWNAAWWETYGAQDPHRELFLLKGTEKGGNITFAAPFFMQKRMSGKAFGWEHLLWISNELSPYPELLVLKGFEADAWKSIFNFCLEHRPAAWFQLNDIFEGDSLETWTSATDRRIIKSRGSVCLRLDLGKRMLKDTRFPEKRSIRRTMNKAKRLYQREGLEWRIIYGMSAPAYNTLIRLNLSAFGNKSFFSRTKNLEFLERLSVLAGDEFIHCEVSQRGRPIHELLLFRCGGTWSHFISGMEATSKYLLPGFINFDRLIGEMKFREADTLDFLRGAERYKADLGGVPRKSSHWRIVPDGARVRYSYAECFRRIRRAFGRGN